jgi:hypothetical protein
MVSFIPLISFIFYDWFDGPSAAAQRGLVDVVQQGRAGDKIFCARVERDEVTVVADARPRDERLQTLVATAISRLPGWSDAHAAGRAFPLVTKEDGEKNEAVAGDKARRMRRSGRRG